MGARRRHKISAQLVGKQYLPNTVKNILEKEEDLDFFLQKFDYFCLIPEDQLIILQFLVVLT